MKISGIYPLFTKPFQALISCYFWFEVFALAAILTPVAVLIFLITVGFDKRLFIQHKFTCTWSFIVLKINPIWKIRIIGREKINKNATYVMVSNHQSGADIIVLFLLWKHFKWVAKKSLFYFPFIGWNMLLNGYVPLERGKTTSMRKMLAESGKLLRERNSIMIFPEGTRSKDGKLQPFKSGAFHLALENQVPILPIAITGTSKAIRKGGFLINPNYDIRATVLDPIPYSEIKGKDPKAVSAIVHAKIAEFLG